MAERESPYLWSTTAANNNSIDPSINFAEGQLPGTLNNSNRAKMAADARFLKDTNGSLTTTGSANAYALTINGTQTAYATGHTLRFKANFTNTGAATLNVTNADATALGAKAIRGQGDVALLAGQMISGGVYEVRYDTAANAAAGAFILLNPDATSVATMTSAGAISGASAAGTMVATQSDQETATSTATLVSPGRQQFHPSAPKAWLYVTVSGGTPTLAASYNITSISDSGVGQLGVTVATDLSSANHTVVVSVSPANFGDMASSNGRAAGSINLFCGSAASGFVDPNAYDAVWLGDQ